MLEGQVAALSSGLSLRGIRSHCLTRFAAAASIVLTEQLRLYPDRKLPGFLEKNNIPAAAIAHQRRWRR